MSQIQAQHVVAGHHALIISGTLHPVERTQRKRSKSVIVCDDVIAVYRPEELVNIVIVGNEPPGGNVIDDIAVAI